MSSWEKKESQMSTLPNGKQLEVRFLYSNWGIAAQGLGGGEGSERSGAVVRRCLIGWGEKENKLLLENEHKEVILKPSVG